LINCVIIAHVKIIRKHLIVDGGIFLKNIKWIFVFYSIAAIASMCAIGVAVGMSSPTIAIIAILALILIMGNGFKTKKKYREQGLL
jgi:hypothetical protein